MPKYYVIEFEEDTVKSTTPTIAYSGSFTGYTACPNVLESKTIYGPAFTYGPRNSTPSNFFSTTIPSTPSPSVHTPSPDSKELALEEFVRTKQRDNQAAEVFGHLPEQKLKHHAGEWNQTNAAAHLPLDVMLMMFAKDDHSEIGQLFKGVTARVRYLSMKERKRYKVRFVGDRLLNFRGRPCDTSGARTLAAGMDRETNAHHSSRRTIMGDIMNRFIFVMSPKGKLYIADFANEYKAGGYRDLREFKYGVSREMIIGFHHSSFLAGNPVACAGELEIRQGRLLGISNASGHYMPSAGHLYNCIKQIAKHTRGLLKIQKLEVTLLKPTDRWGNFPLRFRGHDFMAAMKRTSKSKRFEPHRYGKIFENTRMLRKDEHWFR